MKKKYNADSQKIETCAQTRLTLFTQLYDSRSIFSNKTLIILVTLRRLIDIININTTS